MRLVGESTRCALCRRVRDATGVGEYEMRLVWESMRCAWCGRVRDAPGVGEYEMRLVWESMMLYEMPNINYNLKFWLRARKLES